MYEKISQIQVCCKSCQLSSIINLNPFFSTAIHIYINSRNLSTIIINSNPFLSTFIHYHQLSSIFSSSLIYSYSNLRPSTKGKHFREIFYVCNATFGRLKRKPFRCKTRRFCNYNCRVMSCFDARFINFCNKTYQFRGVEAFIEFQMIQKR